MKKISKSVRVRNSLQFRTFLYFAAYALLLIFIIWTFNILLNQLAYNRVKLNSMKEAGAEIVEYDLEGRLIQMHQCANENNMEVIIFQLEADDKIDFSNINGVVFANSPHSPESGVISFETSKVKKELIESVLDKTQKGGGEYSGDEGSISLLVYARIYQFEGETRFLYASTPTLVQEGLMKDMSRQLLWISSVAVALALFISYLLSRQISKPISNMSTLARKLADNDFSVRFDGNGYNEIDELSDTLNYATQELSKTVTMRKDMVANVSHDLKTPLTLIKASAEMLKEFPNAPPQKIQERLDTILKETDRMTRLINRMTELTLSESGNIKPNKSIFDLSQLVKSVVESFAVKVAEGYNVEVAVDEGLSVFADPAQIQQVLYNFIDNAFKYAGEDKKISISLKRMNNIARFDCMDGGAGLSEREKSKIWDRYYRSSGGYTRSQGTGLGLSIVKSILTSHGAAFGVNSVEGKGSDFFFELPICKAK